jgi:hypothetical protein
MQRTAEAPTTNFPYSSALRTTLTLPSQIYHDSVQAPDKSCLSGVRPPRRITAAIEIGALTSLRRTLHNRLFLLLDFGSLSLSHLLLLSGVTQTSDLKRGTGHCHKS